MNFLAVGIGGFIGAILRYSMCIFVSKIIPTDVFPVSTFLVNVIGSFFMGLSFQFFVNHGLMGSKFQLFIMVGGIGGFTTLAALGIEVISMMDTDRLIASSIYMGMTFSICVIFMYLGKSLLQ